MYRPGHLAIAVLTLLSACDSDVTDADGGGGSGASGGGGVGAAGAGGSGGTQETGGMGGGGGEQPEPVPSCEVLEPTGAPYLLPGENTRAGAIAPFSDERLLIVFGTPDGVVSGWVPDPFTSWPPAGESPLVDHRVGGYGAGAIRSRADGAFIHDVIFGRSESWGGKSGVPGMFFESEDVYLAHLQPDGEGYYTVDANTLSFYATLTDAEPTEEIDLPGLGDQLGSDGDGRPVVQIDGTLFTISDATALEVGQAPPLYHVSILPREGGVWYAGQLTNEGSAGDRSVEVWAIDASGSEVVRPFADAAMNQVGYGVWRDQGVVVAAAGYATGDYHVAVTDGVNVTTATVSQADSGYAQNGISVVASPDGTSVYVGYLGGGPEGVPSFAIQRFDCLSP